MPAPLPRPAHRSAASARLRAAPPAADAVLRDRSPAAALGRLRPGTGVRVHSRAAGVVEGTFVSAGHAGVVLAARGAARTIPLDDVLAVSARADDAGRGAGLGIGALAALALGLFLAARPARAS